MTSYLTRFRFFLLALAFGLASVWFVNSWTDATLDEEFKSAVIITPTLAPWAARFSETTIFTGPNRVHSYGFRTNDGEEFVAGVLGCDFGPEKSEIYRDQEKVAYRFEENGRTIVRTLWLRSKRCIHGPSLELNLELAEFLKGTHRDPEAK